jgi:lipopolysaccharide/colanic/teichoic acid biosynthesis glycosyltransferase
MRHMRQANSWRAEEQQFARVPAERVVDRSVAKRTVDLVLATTLLVVLSPLVLAIALAVVVDSRGGVLFCCTRVGQGGRTIRMLKFRKMHRDATGPALTVVNDGRFTRVGRFLARSKLDELPQLWNVVRGDMSLVGPRPEDPGFVRHLGAAYDEILVVKPGITGLCQLAFAKEAEIIDPERRVDDYVSRLLPQKIALDRLYAHNRRLWLDLRILAWTVLAVILRLDVAVNRSTGQLSLRRRPNGYVEPGKAQGGMTERLATRLGGTVAETSR